jgi:hypothetical protein
VQTGCTQSNEVMDHMGKSTFHCFQHIIRLCLWKGELGKESVHAPTVMAIVVITVARKEDGHLSALFLTCICCKGIHSHCTDVVHAAM